MSRSRLAIMNSFSIAMACALAIQSVAWLVLSPTAVHSSGHVQPTGGLGGLNGGGGQYSLDLSNGRRIGGGAPFDQSQMGQCGRVPPTGEGASRSVAPSYGADGGTGRRAGGPRAGAAGGTRPGSTTETATWMVERPGFLLILPRTVSARESFSARSAPGE